MSLSNVGEGVYWQGADGNFYMKASGFEGVQQWKAPLLTPIELGLKKIPDPNQPEPTPIVTGDGGSGAAAPVLNQAGIDNTQLSIDQYPGLLDKALKAEATNYGNAVADFGAQEKAQRETYGESTTTNQQNYDANFMDSIRAGIKGLGGLMALLRGTGAAGGSVEDEVRDTVGGVTAKDIRTGKDTREQNQGALDTSLETFLDELRRKREVNEDARVNNESAIKRENFTQLQDLYGKMAGFYGDVGNQTAYENWMHKAGMLTPRIAENSATRVSNYDTTPIAVKAPEIAAFADPTQPSVLAPPSDGQVGSGIFTMSDRRRKQGATPGLVPVGA